MTVLPRASDTGSISSVLTQIQCFLIDSFLRASSGITLLSRVKLANLFADFKPVVAHSSLFIQYIYSLKASNIKVHLSLVLHTAMNNEIRFQSVGIFLRIVVKLFVHVPFFFSAEIQNTWSCAEEVKIITLCSYKEIATL